MTESLNLILGHPSPETLSELQAILKPKHKIVASCDTVARIREAAQSNRPDLIVTAIAFPDGDGLDTIIKIGQDKPLPAVILTSKRSLALVEKAMLDHVMAYLIEPVQDEELHAAIIVAHGRFRQLEELTAEVEDLRQALQDRKIIERAKGVLMATQSIDEAKAFASLRKAAQDHRIRLVEAAQRTLDEHA